MGCAKSLGWRSPPLCERDNDRLEGNMIWQMGCESVFYQRVAMNFQPD
jgi:hypothetical protein